MVGLKRASPAKARLPRVALIARYISPPHLIYRTPVGGSGRVDIPKLSRYMTRQYRRLRYCTSSAVARHGMVLSSIGRVMVPIPCDYCSGCAIAQGRWFIYCILPHDRCGSVVSSSVILFPF